MTSCRLSGMVGVVALAVSVVVAAPPKTHVYLASNDHTDLFWTADLRAYEKAFLETIDYYLDRADETEDRPAPYQSRFSCDGNYWMWLYEQRRPRKQFLRLIKRIKDGHINVNLAPLCISPGGLPAEAILRGMYYPGRVEREHGVRFPVAHACENPTYPLSLASLWAGAGAKYSWGGNFGGDTRVPGHQLRRRKHEIFWWVGPGGRRLLMKWPSLVAGDGVGGYAEARRPGRALEHVTSNRTFHSRYPYPIIGLFGKGWDDLKTTTTEIEKVAVQKTTSARQVYVSNQVDFFEHFEKTFGPRLPQVTESYGNEWDLYVATLAELTGRLKRAVEQLRTAEALALLVSRRRPGFLSARKAARERAWMSLGLYAEHDINMIGKDAAAIRARLAWQKELVGHIESYVHTLYRDGLAALGGMIANPGDSRRFFVFNPLSWSRTDVVDVSHSDPQGAVVIDVGSGTAIPSQPVTVAGVRHLRILASDVPAIGYKVFEVRKGRPERWPPGPRALGATIENGRYRLTVAPRGAITSLVDKQHRNREFVRAIGGFALNDLGLSSGRAEVDNSGPVSATLKVTAPRPVPHTTRITLYRGMERIDIRNEITQAFDDTLIWRFGFSLRRPEVWHEECGTVLRARPITAGGHYATWAARVDWLSLNHFADIGGAQGEGVILSNADCCFMKLGRSTPTQLDTDTPQIGVLAGGRVGGSRSSGIRRQGGSDRFLQRFALRTRQRYRASAAMRFAMEHQNPLVAGRVTHADRHYPAKSLSLVTVSHPDVLVWALKPTEEGITRGIILRAWNLADTPARVTFTVSGGVAKAYRTTHIETDTGPVDVRSGRLVDTLPARHMQTYRVLPKSAGE